MNGFLIRTIALVASVFLLSSCGGGADGAVEESCSGQAAIVVHWTYNPTEVLEFEVGKSTTYKPTLTGIPKACLSEMSFGLNPPFTRPWLGIEGKSGEIVGAPAATYTCDTTTDPAWKQCNITAEFTLQIAGYSSIKKRLTARVVRPA